MQKQVTKPYEIDRWLIKNAYQKVKQNKGSAGIDDVTIEMFEGDLRGNLYKLWNRMSSGSYFPRSVKLVEIPKSNGGKRPLGIPTVADRVAQMSAVMMIEPLLEPIFHADSYGYRPNRNAHDAISTARERCWRHDWVLDMDISKFFDTIDHELLMKAVELHVKEPWILLYIRRWLVVPYELKTGERIERSMGVPQGSVIGPILANLFLHYVFDKWMEIHHPHIPFERYADDSVCHCHSLEEAQGLKASIAKRFSACKLKLNEEKTRIVYCKDSYKKGDYKEVSFDFLGYTFRPRKAISKRGNLFTGFLPGISQKAKNRIRDEIRSWRLKRNVYIRMEDIARRIDPIVRGWITYYGKFYASSLKAFLQEVNYCLTRWVTNKYKRFRGKPQQAYYWLGKIAKRNPTLFYHWKYGVVPTAPKSRKAE
jgi:RNA-directed DNA polymerase